MNRFIWLVVEVLRKGIRKFISEPINRSMLECHGKNVHFGKGVQGNLENVSCGNNVSFGGDNLFLSSKAKVRIGDNVMFGPGVTVVTGDHRIDVIGKPMIAITDADKLPENDQNVVIEGDNWIGANAIILKGVTIGEGAVVAAGTLVIRNVEPYSIVGGVPARKIKDRFSESELEKHRLLMKK